MDSSAVRDPRLAARRKKETTTTAVTSDKQKSSGSGEAAPQQSSSSAQRSSDPRAHRRHTTSTSQTKDLSQNNKQPTDADFSSKPYHQPEQYHPQRPSEDPSDRSTGLKSQSLNPLDMTEELYESAKASFGEELLQKCQYRYFNPMSPGKFSGPGLGGPPRIGYEPQYGGGGQQGTTDRDGGGNVDHERDNERAGGANYSDNGRQSSYGGDSGSYNRGSSYNQGRYDGGYRNRYDNNRSESRYETRYDNRYENRYESRYDNRQDNRYDNRREGDNPFEILNQCKQMLRQESKHEYESMIGQKQYIPQHQYINDSFQRAQRTAVDLYQQLYTSPMAFSNEPKQDRQMYIGNLPPGLTCTKLVEILNFAMLVLGDYDKNLYGNPVVSCWISQDGHFAFVEFRTIEEMHQGFILGQLSLFGRPIKVGRTKHSINSEALASMNAKTQVSMPTPYGGSSTILGNQQLPTIEDMAKQREDGKAAEGANSKETSKTQPPSSVEVCMDNLAYVIKFSDVPIVYKTDQSAFQKLVQMFAGGQSLPVLRFSETDKARTANESKEAADVEMSTEELKKDQDDDKQLEPQSVVFCFCMLDSSPQVDKAISGMDGLQVRDNQVLKAAKVDESTESQNLLTQLFVLGSSNNNKQQQSSSTNLESTGQSCGSTNTDTNHEQTSNASTNQQPSKEATDKSSQQAENPAPKNKAEDEQMESNEAPPAQDLSSPVLKLENMLSLTVLTTEQDFELAHEDLKEECQKYGRVVKLTLPRPNHLIGAVTHQQQQAYEPQPQHHQQQFNPKTGRYVLNQGASFAYVQFETPQEAQQARVRLGRRTYYGRQIIATFYPLEDLTNENFY